MPSNGDATEPSPVVAANWQLARTLAATLFVTVLAMAVSLLPFLAGVALSPASMLGSIILSQLVMGLGAWWLAGRSGRDRRTTLSLGPMGCTMAQAVLTIIAMFSAIAAVQAFRHYALGHDIFADMRAMAPLFQSPYWPVAMIVLIIGAPLAEELLFRGFLQSGYGRSPTAFWSGAFTATGIWTLLHFQYGVPALLLVALMGLMFSAMLRWTGSVRLPLLAHAANNASASFYLLFFMT